MTYLLLIIIGIILLAFSYKMEIKYKRLKISTISLVVVLALTFLSVVFFPTMYMTYTVFGLISLFLIVIFLVLLKIDSSEIDQVMKIIERSFVLNTIIGFQVLIVFSFVVKFLTPMHFLLQILIMIVINALLFIYRHYLAKGIFKVREILLVGFILMLVFLQPIYPFNNRDNTLPEANNAIIGSTLKLEKSYEVEIVDSILYAKDITYYDNRFLVLYDRDALASISESRFEILESRYADQYYTYLNYFYPHENGLYVVLNGHLYFYDDDLNDVILIIETDDPDYVVLYEENNYLYFEVDSLVYEIEKSTATMIDRNPKSDEIYVPFNHYGDLLYYVRDRIPNEFYYDEDFNSLGRDLSNYIIHKDELLTYEITNARVSDGIKIGDSELMYMDGGNSLNTLISNDKYFYKNEVFEVNTINQYVVVDKVFSQNLFVHFDFLSIIISAVVLLIPRKKD